MSRQGDNDAKSTQSVDSLEERLKLARINRRLNEFIPDVPEADFTHPRDFLKTDSDEELALKAHFTYKSPFDLPGESSSSSQPNPRPQFSAWSTESEMDRRLRQSKPRLLLMGQRRYELISLSFVIDH
jgi:hypothetical protein